MLEVTHTELTVLLLISAAAGWVLRKNLWRAVVWLAPTTVRVEDDAPASARLTPPGRLQPLASTLEQLGFSFIGTHLEQPRLGAAIISFDYASAEGHAFASLFTGDEDEPRVELLTPLEGGGFVRTANYRRSALEEKGYFSGYLDQVPLDRVVHAHQRRVAAVGTAREQWDTDARLAAARAWYQSPSAARELRQQHQRGLVWSFGAVVSVGIALATLVG